MKIRRLIDFEGGRFTEGKIYEANLEGEVVTDNGTICKIRLDNMPNGYWEVVEEPEEAVEYVKYIGEITSDLIRNKCYKTITAYSKGGWFKIINEKGSEEGDYLGEHNTRWRGVELSGEWVRRKYTCKGVFTEGSCYPLTKCGKKVISDRGRLVSIDKGDPTRWELCPVKQPQTLNEEKKEIIMNESKPVETITYVFGADIIEVNEAKALDLIAKANREKSNIEDLGIESEYTKRKLNEIEAAVTLLIEKLDSF